jgi:hypothetical protein
LIISEPVPSQIHQLASRGEAKKAIIALHKTAGKPTENWRQANDFLVTAAPLATYPKYLNWNGLLWLTIVTFDHGGVEITLVSIIQKAHLFTTWVWCWTGGGK